VGKSKQHLRQATRTRESDKPRLYTLEVFIVEGMISEEFAKRNPILSRTIQIRGDQTLEDLHEIIFKAFDRYDEHMYEFHFGKRTREGPRYVTPFAADDDFDIPFAGVVNETTIDSLGLKKGQAFGYWFDFGDDWYHQIDVESIDDAIPPRKYPHIINRVGESPPQYPEIDEEEDGDDEEEE
jgi:hypothetical protein